MVTREEILTRRRIANEIPGLLNKRRELLDVAKKPSRSTNWLNIFYPAILQEINLLTKDAIETRKAAIRQEVENNLQRQELAREQQAVELTEAVEKTEPLEFEDIDIETFSSSFDVKPDGGVSRSIDKKEKRSQSIADFTKGMTPTELEIYGKGAAKEFSEGLKQEQNLPEAPEVPDEPLGIFGDILETITNVFR